MSAQDSEINRDIDTAEGHRRTPFVEDGDDSVERSVIIHADALDDEAEGHLRLAVLEDGEDAAKRAP